MHRHIPPPPLILPIRKKLAHKILKFIPPLHKHPRFPILQKHHILFLQSTRRTYTRPFFTLRSHVETQSALSLRVEHYDVHDGYGEHVFVHGESEGIRGGGYRGVDYVAVGGGAAVGGDGGVGGGVLEG
jgi:hypothetical protein